MSPPSSNVGASIPTNSIQWDSSWPEWLEGDKRSHLLGFLQNRFGIPESVFANHHLLRRGRIVWLLRKHDRLMNLASLSVESVGLPLLRQVKTQLKPTTAALQLFGLHANKNIVSLALEQLRELVEKKELKGEFGTSPGYVIIAAETIVIGCALSLPGRLLSQFPRYLFTKQTWAYLPTDKGD
jgi:NOL1/NOP2/fmu family ribosome biogenesis protein